MPAPPIPALLLPLRKRGLLVTLAFLAAGLCLWWIVIGGRSQEPRLLAPAGALRAVESPSVQEQVSAASAEELSTPPSTVPPGAAERSIVVGPAGGEKAVNEAAPTDLWLRIVDAAGAPRPGLTLEVELGDGTGPAWIAHADGEGRMLVQVSARRRSAAPACLRLRERAPDGLGVRLAFDEMLAPGRRDLGDVTLALLPVLVSGVVLSPSGAPCEKASVEMLVFDEHEQLVDRAALMASAEGTFEVRDWPHGLSRVELIVRDGSSTNVLGLLVAPGTTGVVVAFEEGGSLVGRVLVDDPNALGHLMCQLVTSEGTVGLNVPVRQAGLVPGRIPAGRYSLRVMLAGHPDPLATVESLVLMNGAPTAPPELNPLDLRGRLRSVGVQASSEDDLPIGVRVRHRSAGGGDSWTVQSHQGPEPLKLYAATAALDVEVASEGYQSAVLFGVTEDVHVKLRPGYPVALSLRDLPHLPAGCELEASLYPVHEGSKVSVSNFEPRAGVARFVLPVAGEYQVKIAVLASDHFPTQQLVPTPSSIHVLDWNSEQAFLLALDQAEIDGGSQRKQDR